MKAITKLMLVIVVGWLHAPASFAAYALIYRGQYASALMLVSGEQRILTLAGGAIPRSSGTNGDCFVKARIYLRKRPNFYEGDLLPVKNDLVTLNDLDVSGKRMGVYLMKDKIHVGGVDVSGICGDFTDFSGDYELLKKGSRRYWETLEYFNKISGWDVGPP